MKESKGFAITSMVLGIVSLALTLLCFGWVYPYIPGPAAIVGLVLGIVSLVQHRAGFGMAVAGVIMCSVTIVFLIIGIIIMSAAVEGDGGLVDQWRRLMEQYRRSGRYV